MALSGSQQSFVNGILPYALATSEQTGIDPRIIIAQSALETGWGQSTPGNNYFGIKGSGNSLPTTEYINGVPQTVMQNFAGYSDPLQSFAGYAQFMSGSRYAGVRNGATLDDQLAALGSSGYATAPNYASKVGAIAKQLTGVVGNGTLSGAAAALKDKASKLLSQIPGLGSLASGGLKSLNPISGLTDGLGITGDCGWICQLQNWIRDSQFFTRVGMVLLAIIFVWAAFSIMASGQATKLLQGAD